MKAVVWRAPNEIGIEQVPDPVLQRPTDALVRVTTSAICGSDLHIFHGIVEGYEAGTVMGHEFVGVVEETGSDVTRVRPGDRVVAADFSADGTCWYCRRGQHWQCPNFAFFGDSLSLPGGQAEYVRIPYADTTLVPVHDDISDEKAVFVGDILATAYAAVLNGGIRSEDTVAVIGCGPLGILAQLCARVLGTRRVVALDLVAKRLQFAEELGSLAIDASDGAREQVLAATDGRGADVVLECAGLESGLALALEVVRPGGVISAVGAHHAPVFPLPVRRMFRQELTLRWGLGNAVVYGTTLLDLIQREAIDPSLVITHRLNLSDAPRGYELFDKKEALKVVLHADR